MFQAITRVPLEDSIVNRFVARIRNDAPSDLWFEDIQEKVSVRLTPYSNMFEQIVEVLRNDDHFYPEFKKSPIYVKMLEELGIIGGEEERSETPNSDMSSLSAVSEGIAKPEIPKEDISNGDPVLSAVVETLGIGCQVRYFYALTNNSGQTIICSVQRTSGTTHQWPEGQQLECSKEIQ